ncbi:hypothetical protein FACS1894217_14570 [Clostridia bacterium]|nr:hypothetical protein FACS1894217_14570 [Clostridia bacterium]
MPTDPLELIKSLRVDGGQLAAAWGALIIALCPAIAVIVMAVKRVAKKFTIPATIGAAAAIGTIGIQAIQQLATFNLLNTGRAWALTKGLSEGAAKDKAVDIIEKASKTPTEHLLYGAIAILIFATVSVICYLLSVIYRRVVKR